MTGSPYTYTVVARLLEAQRVTDIVLQDAGLEVPRQGDHYVTVCDRGARVPASAHREAGAGMHVHVLAARCDLETDKSLNIARLTTYT